MPRQPDPINDPDLYDVIDLAGTKSPGQVKLSGHDREIDWDIKTGAGQSGATTTLKAEKLVTFTASFFLSDADDFAAWPAFPALIKTSISGKGKALDVYHPDLDRQGIKSVVMASIGGVVHDGKGGQTIAVKLLEYKPPKPVKVTPFGSTNKKGPDPNAAANAELAQLTAQYQATPWK